MLPDRLAVFATDVIFYPQKKGRVSVPARSFSTVTLRLKTPGKYVFKSKTLSFEPVSICIIPEGLNYLRDNKEEEIPGIHFQQLHPVFDEIQIFKVDDAKKYQALFDKALYYKQKNEAGFTYHITAILYEIFAELARDVGFTAPSKDQRIHEAADYIRRHFSDPGLSIEEIARKANVSTAFFRREFHRVYGTSPKQYLASFRLNSAKTLLETYCFSQKEIAFRCGFSDVGYFRTAFKRAFGTSIRAYLSASEHPKG